MVRPHYRRGHWVNGRSTGSGPLPVIPLLVLVVILGLLLALVGRLQGSETLGSSDRGVAATVSRVVDGDTFVAFGKGGESLGQVQIIGINAPEPPGKGKRSPCWAAQARDEATRLLKGKTVALVPDAGQSDKGPSGRLMRYVEADGVDVGRELLLAGAARTFKHGDVPIERLDSYRRAQSEAKSHGRGLWKACG